MLKFGFITEVNLEDGTVRVNFTDDNIVSNPLPVSIPLSKEDKFSFPLSINEPVWCLMDEHCEFGVVGGAIYNAKNTPPNGGNANNILININNDKVILNINRETGALKIETQNKIELNASDVNITGNLHVDGNIKTDSGNITTATGDIKAMTISLKTHMHTSGPSGGTSTPPLP